ncbi:MAG TPA: hypothetical protein VEC38_11055 [Candidatus Binataceae bacterium]|nr:hypothetical protein [Candidatus Binataceae bacterium]
MISVTKRRQSELGMSRLYLLGIAASLMLVAGVARAQYGGYQQPGQYPLLDRAANIVIEKYRNSSCEQLWQDRNQPKSEEQQRAVEFLRTDPQIRRMFIDRVAAPVANKLFECGMIP